jgi:hypothetical protein
MQINTEVLQKKFKTGLPYDPAIPILGIYKEGPRSACSRDACIHMFITVVLEIQTEDASPGHL